MASSDKSTDRSHATEAEADVNLAGWDPYIVALTGTPHQNAAAPAGNAASDHVDGRKIQLMAWLHEHDR